MSTAHELFDARHYPSVVAVVSSALEREPEHVPLLLLRARSYIALRRDLEAQTDLRDIIRVDPQCSAAFRLLGTLAARRDEHDSAAIFFREALRLDPQDREAAEWLAIVDQPRPVRPRASSPRPTMPLRAPSEPRAEPLASRFARGTVTPRESPVRARGSEPTDAPVWKTPAPRPPADTAEQLAGLKTTITGQMPARGPSSLPPRPLQRGSTPELPGFGEYLVASGILTRERLRAAQAYQRSMKVHLSTAIVTLGLATPQRIEWAAVSHQSQLARV